MLFDISQLMNSLLNPHAGMTLGAILITAFVLGILHGVTPDEHTWPITFSYAVGSFSTRKGMKAGFSFSAGFTFQRALLTTLGFIGLAAFYRSHDIEGPMYIIVGVLMALAGAYILNKRRYIHLPIDKLLGGKVHHTEHVGMLHAHESGYKPIPAKMAVLHGLVAGFGFGAYATIITFVLAPQVPGLLYAPLPGVCFGLGTMVTQIAFGAIFANLAKAKKVSEADMNRIGRSTAGRTLYYGGAIFAVVGALVTAFPLLNNLAVKTGNPIPNLDVVGVSTLLILVVVGGIGIGSLVKGFREVAATEKRHMRGKRRRSHSPKNRKAFNRGR